MPAARAAAHARPIPVAKSEIGYGARFVSREAWRLLFAFLGVLLPLLGFAALGDELREGEVFFFDQPVMLALHQMATPVIDRFFVLMSKLGYEWGVVPVNVAILGWLIYRRQLRDGLFFGLAVIGSLVLNLAAKNHFARIRPDFWASLAPETTYSFPSGHAMASATLGAAIILLLWPTRWRWPAFFLASAFIALVGLSRVYLGVHFPSDILAGWAAAVSWVLLMHQLVARRSPTPPSTPCAPAEPDLIAESKAARATGARQPKAS